MKIITYILICIIGLGVIFRLAKLDGTDLSADEGIQFWVAKGSNAYSMHFSPRGKIEDVIKSNVRDNLDPPLFSVLLHYWLRIDNSIAWLRLLPCLFGIAVLPLIYLIARVVNFNRLWSLVITAFCSSCFVWIHYSRELRVYSFVIFCSTLTLYFILRLIKNNASKTIDHIGLAFAISLGLFSHYGFWILLPFLFIITIIIIMLNKKQSLAKRVRNILIFLIPTLITVSYIVFQQLIYQWDIGTSLPDVHMLRLEAGSNFLQSSKYFFLLLAQTISWQLFAVPGIYPAMPDVDYVHNMPFLVSLLSLSLIFVYFFVLIKLIREKRHLQAVPLAVFIFTMITCIILSFAGLYPIGPVRQSLFFSPFLIISFFICIRYISKSLTSHAKVISKRSNDFLSILLIAILIVLNLHYSYQELKFKKFENTRGILKKISNEDANIYMFIYFNATPVFKYHYFYSDIPIFKKINMENIYIGSSCRISSEECMPRDIDNFLTFFAKNKRVSPVYYNYTLWYIFSFINNYKYNKYEKIITEDRAFTFAEKLKTEGATALKVKLRLNLI